MPGSSTILPWKNEGPAYNSVRTIQNAALAAGHKVPEGFLFYSGQVFYKDRKPEEVRLSGFPKGAIASPWTTPTSPRLTQEPDGGIVLDPTDEGRLHLSALTIGGEKVALLWDLGPDNLDTIFLKTETPLFQTSDIAIVATPGVMLSSVQSLIRKDLWKDDQEGKPFLRRDFSGNRFVEHYIAAWDPSSRYPEALAGKAAWKIIEQFGVSTAYMHLAFSAYAAEQDRPWTGMFHLKGTDLIKMLGMDRRTDLTRAEKFKEIAKQAHLLGSLGVWVAWSEGKMDLNVRTSRMWDVAVDLHGQLGLFGKEREKEKLTEPTEITITVRPGLWTEKFLNQEGHRAGTALRQFGYLAKETLKINPYQKELAARLAVYLTIMGRMRETYRVKTLLEAVEPKEVLAIAQQDFRQRYRLKQRWDDALLDLKELSWKIEFNPETYPEEIRPEWALPGDRHQISRKLPTGYLNILLEARITIAQPEPIPQLITTGTELSLHKNPTLTKASGTSTRIWLTGSQVKKAREAKGWSQRNLATIIGKNQSWIARFEKDKQKIQPEDQEQLQKVLDIVE